MIKGGLTRAYAKDLQQIIAKNTNNRFKAFLTGLGVTAILQSSTATTMLCVSFASKRMIGTAAAIAVIIGADLSTSLVAQILVFDLSWLMPLLLIGGLTMYHYWRKSGRLKHVSRAVFGLGLVLLALFLIKHNSAPLVDAKGLPILLGPLEQEPILAIVLAAFITWVLYSSLAFVLIIASLVSTGVIAPSLGIYLVLGANIGAGFVAYMLTLKMDSLARQITTANVIMRVTTALALLPIAPIIFSVIDSFGLSIDRDIVVFHTVFNVFLAAIYLPLTNMLARLCGRLVPATPEDDAEKVKPIYLDETALNSPTIALASAARETLRMAKIVEDMFTDIMLSLKSEKRDLLKTIKKNDDIVDSLHGSIKLYLSRVNEESLDPKESERFLQILSFSTNLEHAGDVIVNSLIDIVELKIDQKFRFSDEGFLEIKEFHSIILQNMKMAQALFMSEDDAAARQLIANKTRVREKALESEKRHFKRLREGVPETIATSALHTDVIRDYRRINSYITTVAYTMKHAE